MQDFHIIEATETIETPLAPQRVEGSEFMVHRTSLLLPGMLFWGGGAGGEGFGLHKGQSF